MLVVVLWDDFARGPLGLFQEYWWRCWVQLKSPNVADHPVDCGTVR